MCKQHIVIDFEMNPVERKRKDIVEVMPNEIIEVGAVKLDEKYNVVDKFHRMVRPQYNTEIMRRITKLTGITTADVAAADTYANVMRAFEEWIGYDKPSRIYSWSNSDLAQIKKEGGYKGVTIPENLSDWVDFQAIYPNVMEIDNGARSMSLHAAAEQFGIVMDKHSSHTALYDAEITAELVIMVLNGEYKTQVEVLRTETKHDPEETTYNLGESCDKLKELLRQMQESA